MTNYHYLRIIKKKTFFIKKTKKLITKECISAINKRNKTNTISSFNILAH